MNAEQYYFPVFKGLQKPLEFMGLRGRFLTLAAAGIGVSFLGGCICLALISQIVGLCYLLVSSVISLLIIYIKQKQGLHSKKRSKDLLIYHNLYES